MKKSYIQLFSLFISAALILFIVPGAFGQVTTQKNNPARWRTNPFDNEVFIQNNGQFDGLVNSGEKVLYGVHLGEVNIYFTRNKVVYRYDKNIYNKTTGANADPDEIKSIDHKTYFLSSEWTGADKSTYILAKDEQQSYYTYPLGLNKTIKANIFKRIIYKNLYPGVDAVYQFIKGKDGIKYSLIVHPGADLSKIKINYSGANHVSRNNKGDLIIDSRVNVLTEHAPVTYYEGEQGSIRFSNEITGNTESFKADENYDKSKTLVIDPWLTDPLFTAVGWDKAYDMDWDYNGNVYAYGGHSASLLQLVKMNSLGVIQWTYNASNISVPCYGDFATDKVTGTCYVAQGFGAGIVQKINTLGSLTGSFPGDPTVNELWRAEYDACNGNIVLAAGGTSGTNQAGVLDTNMSTINPVNIMNVATNCHDNALIAIDPNGKYCYMASARSLSVDPTHANNVIMKLPLPSLSPTIYAVNEACHFIEVSSIAYAGLGGGGRAANGMNGAAASPDWLYLYNGDTVRRHDKATGAYVSSFPIRTNTPFKYGGLDVDNLNNLYIGVDDSIYIVDSNYVVKSKILLPDTVFDVRAGQGNALYACGRGYVTQLINPVYRRLIQDSTGTPSSCSACDGRATVKVIGGISPYIFKWSNGSTSQTDSGLCEGIYTVTVTDASCPPKKDSAYVTISSKPGYTATVADTNPACNKKGNIMVFPTGGNAPYTYNWSNGATTQKDTGLVAGTYTCTITDASGCKFPISVTLVNAASPIVTVSPPKDSICSGTTITLTAYGAKNYTWNPGNINGSIVNVSPGSTTTYSVIGVDSNGCKDTADVTIKVLTSPKPIITGTDTICAGGTATLNSNGGFISYTWLGGVNSPNSQNTTANPAVTTTYTLTVSNGICKHDTTFTVTVSPAITPSVTAVSDSICSWQKTVLTGTGGGTYKWSPGGGTYDTAQVYAGTYTLTVTKNGCSATVTITVHPKSNTPVTVNASPNPICPNDSTTLTAAGGSSYSWSTGATGAVIKVLPKSTRTYKVYVTTPCGVDTLSQLVTVKPPPAITTSGDTTICKGTAANIWVTGGGTYSWNPSSSLTCNTCSNPTASPTITTTYTITVTAPDGCTKDTTIKVTPKNKQGSVTPNEKVCTGSDVTLSASPAGSTYKWSTGATTSSITVTPVTNVCYTVIVSNGCPDTLQTCLTVKSPPLVTAFFVPNGRQTDSINKGDTAYMFASSTSNNYTWSPVTDLSCSSCSNPMATPTVTTTYTITSDSGGCTTQRTLTVYVEIPCADFQVPNVFTPNNDGRNDDFVVNVLNPTSYSITIYDRWGKKVYTSTDPTAYWTGHILSTQDMVPDGVYYYTIKTSCGTSSYVKKGFVQVLTGK